MTSRGVYGDGDRSGSGDTDGDGHGELEMESGTIQGEDKGRDARWKIHDVLWDSFVCFGRPGEVNALCDFFVIFMRFLYHLLLTFFCDASFVNGWIPV